MFFDVNLQNHLEQSSSVKLKSLVTAEWNMNIPGNISTIGNYRYRPTEASSAYNPIASTFDPSDALLEIKQYTGATDADIAVDGGFEDYLDPEGNKVPMLFLSTKEKERLLYSLEDCFGKFRPRSGINKARFIDGINLHHTNPEMSNRPRFYMSSKNDIFKYWSSYRTESSVSNSAINVERGIANQNINGKFYIDDAAPFVVYKDAVPANRIVVKMQTGVGTVDLGPFQNESGSIADPMFGYENQKTPLRWKIQYLANSTWYDAISFDENSARLDGSQPIPADGHVELAYGPLIPDEYRRSFKFIGEIYNESLLPENGFIGNAYLVKASTNDIGTFFIMTPTGFKQFSARYGWYLNDDNITSNSAFVSKLSAPQKYTTTTNLQKYREFEMISGVRVVAETMNKQYSTLDIIEISPRLVADISDMITDFEIKKSASDIGISGMPVGQLLASTGSIGMFDPEQIFNENNKDSIISGYQYDNVKFSFYEIVEDVDSEDGTFDYYVPIKTMYSETKPDFSSKERTVKISTRDLFFYLESIKAPELLIQNASVSYATSLVLDSIGFSNYSFFKTENEQETIIPFFFVSPNQTVAEVLQNIAVSTQTAMFFDEYNNFIMMSKNYIMPSEEDRATNAVVSGSPDQARSGVVENQGTSQRLSNIIDIASSDSTVYNAGKITYTTRYIQRAMGSLRQAMLIDRDRTWIYQPALLWQVSASGNVKSINEKTSDQSAYLLSAIPINSALSSAPPTVVNRQLVNNILDFGEAIQWLGRYNGYFYANGEVIRYDAIEYSIPGVAEGNVWITNLQEYQNYFSKLPFNGKMYPTGRVRIFAIPNYETLPNGATAMVSGNVAKHGRGQFGTPIVEHSAGLSSYWSDNANVKGVVMDQTQLFFQNDRVEISGASSTGQSITVVSTENLKVGQAVEISSGPGAFAPGSTPRVLSITSDEVFTVDTSIVTPLNNTTIILYTKRQEPFYGKTGATFENTSSNLFAQKTTRNGIIKNFMTYFSNKESTINNLKVTEPGAVQSSALVMNGPSFANNQNPVSFVSYVHKPLSDKFKHFGTRLRIIGKIEDSKVKSQTPVGANPYYEIKTNQPDKDAVIGGASGGLAISINPETNNGYYFELISLTAADANSYADGDGGAVNNIMFYKLSKPSANALPGAAAVPIKLWGGNAEIISDSGSLTGKARLASDAKVTVYDLAVEYEEIGSALRFYLYLNGRLLSVVDDTSPELGPDNRIVTYNNLALFVRGSARVMFENVFAIANNYSQNTSFGLDTPIHEIYGDPEVDVSESMRKYAMSGMIQSTYLSGISPAEPPRYNIYFEEFGTIMREAAYFNVKYDKAYPALYAQLSPTFNKVKGYSVSGFTAGAYGAEFLVFNATDTQLLLDDTSGNYLRIQGVTFTQESQHELTVDEYFTENSNFSDPQFESDGSVRSPLRYKEAYQGIKFSRMTSGKKEFSIDPPYIQSQDAATNLMGWLIEKTMKPRKSVGVKLFAMPTIQLGDIVSLDYVSDNVEQFSADGKRFVVYSIEYKRSSDGPEMTVYLSEVV